MHPETRRILRWITLLCVLALGGGIAVLSFGRAHDRALVTREAQAATEAGFDVTLEPAGTVHFAHVPRRILTVDANYNDMLVALDQEARQVATGYQGNFYDGFYAQLPGLRVNLDQQKLKYIALGGMDKETLYAIGAEVHHVDPVQLLNTSRWKPNDIEEIAHNVGPFFANRYSRENSLPGNQDYRFYTLWELSERVGEVYQAPARIQALEAVHREMVTRIQARLPPVEQRPSVGLVMYAKGKFTPFSLDRQGFGTAHYRAVGARDAFAGIKHLTYSDGGAAANLDVEGLLAIDPDILIMPFAVYPSYRARYEELLALTSDPLVGRLKAYRDHKVHPGGTPLQGPVFLLFQTEMTAKQIYPEIFGAFHADHRYAEAEQLFDRVRVAEILKETSAI